MKDARGYGRDPDHGMVGTPTYESWGQMMRRCLNPKADQFKYYGGRGIQIDASWKKFSNFFADMGVRPEGTKLDRVDPNGNYEPDNCRWSRNLSFNRSNTNWFEVDGERLPLAHAARRLGIWPNSIYQRLKAGWSRNQIVEHYRK